MPGRQLFFQGEMSFLAEHVAYDMKHEKRMQRWRLWIFRNIVLLKSFYYFLRRQKISHKVKKFLQHKFWSNLISTLHMFMYKLYTDCNLRMKKGKMSQWNIKLKYCSDHVYFSYCNQHFQIIFFITFPYRLRDRLMVWEFICRTSNTDDIRLTTSSKKTPKANTHAIRIIPGLFDKVSRD